MKHLLVLSFCALFLCPSLAQNLDRQLLSTAGEQSTFANGQLDWAIGEPFVQTVNLQDGFLSEGFIQPDIFSELFTPDDLTENIEEQLDLIVFPNPVITELNLQLTAKKNICIQVNIFDLNGQAVYQTILPIEMHQSAFDISQLPAGLYFLRLTDSKGISLGSTSFAKM